jgi:pimeloyl-ACP methyl ester carboxylesterase
MNLFFRKFGTGEPLIIMHGLFGISDNWNTLSKKYGEHFTTYTVDLRNHGQSGHHEIWNYAAMATDIAELMETEQIESAHIMGHSMGGKVAMFMADTFAHKINRLIVSDIGPKYYAPHHREILDALNGLDLNKVTTRKEAEAYMAASIPDYGVQQFLLKNLYWNDEKKLAWRFNLPVITREIENVGEALPAHVLFEGPTLFIRGGKSNYILDTDIDLITEHFPQSTLRTIEGAGHWVHAEKPLEYLKETLLFLL